MQPDAHPLEDFFALAALGSDDQALLRNASRVVSLARGTQVFEAGQPCAHYLFIQSGVVRVHLLDPDGHEITLYRLDAGDTCILTTAALLGNQSYAAYAVTETETVATMLPASVFEALLAQSSAFRRFVFKSFGTRIAALMQTIADVAFTPIQVRLARALLDRADADGLVHMTHDALATELGTAREVISRNLKALEARELVRRHQGAVEIIDTDALAACGQT